MKLTIVGSGTVVPDGARSSAGYFIESRAARLMLDCGAGTVHALARFGLPWESITHVFLSHFHVDHAGELASLMFALKWGVKTPRSGPLVLLGPKGLDRVVKGLEHAFGPRLFEPGFPVEVRTLEVGARVEISRDCHMSVAKTPHNEESLGVKIDEADRSLCYTGDTSYSEELARFFDGADVMISECSFPERRPGFRHLSIEDVSMMATLARAKRLVVTHFYFEVDEGRLKNDLQKGYSGEVIIGRDGMSLSI